MLRPGRPQGVKLELDGTGFSGPTQIAIEFADEFASALVPAENSARTALEALALEAYRARRLSSYRLPQLSGISSRSDLDGFLKRHEVWLDYSVEDFEREGEIGEQVSQKRQGELHPDCERRAG